MLNLSAKLGESKWKPYWLMALKSSTGTNYGLNEHEDFDQYGSFTLLEIGWMTAKNNRALLHDVKLCASFQIHQWIQTGVTVWKHSIRVEIDDILSRVTLKIDGWPWKTMGHLFYTTSSFVHHFKSIGEVKLELQSGNAQFGWKLVIFFPVWPWKLTNDLAKPIGHLFYATLSFVHHFKAIGEFKLELPSGNAQLGSKSAIFCPVWPWNLVDDLENQ